MNINFHQFFRFLIAGCLNTLIAYLVYCIFVLLDFQLHICVLMANIISIIFNFFTYGFFVFKKFSVSFLPRFVFAYMLIGLINYELIKLLIDNGISPIVAQAILLPILAVIGFTIMKFIVFRMDSKNL